MDGDVSSIINGKEYSVDFRGINIVVCDNNNSQVVASINYDTYAPMSRFSTN